MNEKAYGYMDWPRIEAVVYGEEASPKDVTGPRLTPDGVLIQGFFPDAQEAEVLVGKHIYPMEKEDEAGYFAAMIPGRKIPKYRFQVKKDEKTEIFYDAYAFPGMLTEEDERAFCSGVFYQAYDKLGAHPAVSGGVAGTYFAVWAPNAVRVSVVGSFNGWDGRRLPMHRMPMSGIFELFVPGVTAGAVYKYEIKGRRGEPFLKADPYANAAELPPSCASVVADLRDFQWHDEAWMKERRKYADRRQPISIYETDLSRWSSGKELVDFVTELGYTHVELHPVMEYLEESSGGYSTSAYYALTSRIGKPEDFRQLVDALHQAGVGVILDWTPAQFPCFEGGLELFDGTPLYEVKDPAMAVHPVWGTRLYNYESPMVKDFLISNACFWLEKYHADGLRMDDVDAMLYLDYGRQNGGWTPNIYGSNENLAAMEFLKHLNSVAVKRNPGVILIAQEDGLWPELTDSVENDHMGFGYKWSGGWTADFLSYLSVDPIERKWYHDQLTLSMVYAYSEHYVLTLGSRDVGSLEEFMGRLPGNDAQKAAQVREAYTYLMLHPGCKMMAPDASAPAELRACIADLNRIYRSCPALSQMDHDYDGFEWIQLMKYDENVIAFLRKTEKPEETLLAICNFAAVPHMDYAVGVPFYGKYKEIYNSDAEKYGGSGVVNARVKTAKKAECDEREFSVRLNVPALGALILSCTPAEEKPAAKKPAAAKKTAAKKETAEAADEKPAAAKKTVAKKETVKAVEKKPAAAKKTVAKKETVKAAEKKPAAAKKAAVKKGTAKTADEKPAATKKTAAKAAEEKPAKAEK